MGEEHAVFKSNLHC